MKLRNIVYDIRERLKLNSDDIDITDEYLIHLINVKRVFFTKQRFSKFTRNVPEEVKQVICIDLEPIETIVGQPCFGDILASTTAIPSTIEIGGRSSIIGVRFYDKLYPYLNIIPIERMPFVGYNRFLQKQIYVALDADNKLYFTSANPQHLNLKKIQVIGVFSDPEEAINSSCTSDSDNSNCDILDKEYPVENYMIHDIVNSIVKELAPTLQIPNDKVNNADESS